MCWPQAYKTKHRTDGSLLLRDRKKISIIILFQKVFGFERGGVECLGWKKIEKLIRGGDVY